MNKDLEKKLKEAGIGAVLLTTGLVSGYKNIKKPNIEPKSEQSILHEDYPDEYVINCQLYNTNPASRDIIVVYDEMGNLVASLKTNTPANQIIVLPKGTYTIEADAKKFDENFEIDSNDKDLTLGIDYESGDIELSEIPRKHLN